MSCVGGPGLLVAYCSRFDVRINSRNRVYFISCCTGTRLLTCRLQPSSPHTGPDLFLSLCVCVCVCRSLPAGNHHDVCGDAAVWDGPACPALPGALHPDHRRCGGWLQERDEAVLDRNHLRGESVKASPVCFYTGVAGCFAVSFTDPTVLS